MSDLQTAEYVVENFYEEYSSGHPMFTDEDINALKWLIEQAKKTENLKKENMRLNKLIGHYAGKMNEIAGKNQNLSSDANSLAREMFRS